ncbi:hypothetical protein BDN70DRAFT_988765 [Pholiota conissans]|uniref:F-box domain-containing protein n=1 Tax=Pholiota conissans TaxID=109636 RepID=A0A9P5ZC88_9AGAR|nr:hypothetical protein BDN70DRAFT_988765 [Pholiota conissans]
MALPVLPLDVVGVIIENLFKLDPSSVKTCSLVCRAFLPICRRHIFETIAVKDDKGMRKLHRMLSSTPVIASYIHKLDLPFITKYKPDSVSKRLAEITGLRSLSIYNDSYGEEDEPAWNEYPLRRAILHFFCLPSFRVFTLVSVKDFFVADLAPCSNLDYLDLRDLAFTSESPPQIRFPPIKLVKLSVEGMDRSAIAHTWAAKCIDGEPFMDVSALTHLSMEVLSSSDAQAVQDLFLRCPKLLNMHFTAGNWNIGLISLGNILNKSSALRTLMILDLFSIYDSRRGDDPLCGLVDEFERISTENVIKHIKIELSIFSGLDRTQHDKWSRLDKALTRPNRWPKLRQVSLRVKVAEEASKDAHKALEEDFPNFPHTQFQRLSATSSLVFAFSVGLESDNWVDSDFGPESWEH